MTPLIKEKEQDKGEKRKTRTVIKRIQEDNWEFMD